MVSRRVRVVAGGWAAYVGAIALANWLIAHGCPGATATAFHTYTLPVGFGLVAPAGTYAAALTFPARDVVQRAGGRLVGVVAIAAGAAMSWWLSSPSVALASGATFLVAESLDFAVFSPMQRRWFALAVLVSGLFGLTANAALFLYLAHLPLSEFDGLTLGQAWVMGPAFLAAVGLRRAVPTASLAS